MNGLHTYITAKQSDVSPEHKELGVLPFPLILELQNLLVSGQPPWQTFKLVNNRFNATVELRYQPNISIRFCRSFFPANSIVQWPGKGGRMKFEQRCRLRVGNAG